jgi:DNA-binding MarR family transcriptional regulator
MESEKNMSKSESPYNAIKVIFHEPSRLAILSALCQSEEGRSFNELKDECGLTDGNLSRHLKALEESRVIRIRKSFFKSKPLTTVHLTERGRERFIEYLQALEEVLARAAESLPEDEQKAALPLMFGKTVRA